MIRRPAFILIAALCALSAPAAADQSMPLFYSRTHIALTRHHPGNAEKPLPWQNPAAQAGALDFDVEVRDGTTLYNQKGWFNLSSPAERGGVMLVFSAPSMVPVIPASNYMPLDILLVDKEGRIDQIIPNITLSELDHEIYPGNPVLAFLFIKGGLCAELAITPGDEIDYPAFKKPQVILSAPPRPATSRPAPQADAPRPNAPDAAPAGAASRAGAF